MTLLEPPVAGPPEPDPAAPIVEPPPPPENPPQSMFAALADPAAAESNPNRVWQSQVPRLPKQTYSPTPSEEESRTVQRVIELFDAAKEARSPIFRQWQRNYRALFNKHSPKPRRPDWLRGPEFPEILPIALTMSSWITDQRPNINIAAATLPHDEFAAMTSAMATDLQYVLDASYKVNNEERQIGLGTMDGTLYGTSIYKTYWDPWLAGGIGDATFSRVSPFNFYPDPMATSEHDGNYYIEARKMSLIELDRRYPGTFELFEDGAPGGNIDIDEPPDRASLFNGASNDAGPIPGALSPSTRPNTSRSANRTLQGRDPGLDHIVTVLEAWVRVSEDVDVIDARTGQEIERASDEWEVYVVANGRLIYKAHAHDLWDHGKHPYDRCPFVEIGDSFWGMSLVEMLLEPQRAYNRLLASFLHNAELVGQPILKRSGGKSRQQLTNKPGQVIETGPGGDAQWLAPPALNTSMVNVLEFILKRMEAVSGMSAVVKGNTPSGRNAQGVVDAVQEAAFVRIRSILRNVEFALRGVFSKKASLVCANYTTPRMIAVAGRGLERSSMLLKADHFLLPSPNGRVAFNYTLNVDAGSQAHTSRAMREDRAVQLFTLGAIDEEALLSDLDYPNGSVVAERTAQKKMMAEMQPPGARERQRA